MADSDDVPLYRLRMAGAGDASAIEQVRARAVRAGGVRLYTPEQVTAWAQPSDAGRLAKTLDTPDQGGWVAEVTGRVVGFAVLQGDHLSALYVDPPWWHQGIGRALFTAACRHAADHGATQVNLLASLNAVAFYESLGCRRVRARQVAVGDCPPLPVWEMECPVGVAVA